MVYDLGCRVGLGFRGLWFKVYDSGCRVSGFRVGFV